MSTIPHDLKDALISRDAELQRLAAEHLRCDSQLAELQKQSYLNSEDLILEVTLKKVKLRLKDQMEQMLLRKREELGLH